jgi:hypothetical protein
MFLIKSIKPHFIPIIEFNRLIQYFNQNDINLKNKIKLKLISN